VEARRASDQLAPELQANVLWRDGLNLSAPKKGQALLKKQKRPRWPVIRGILLSILFAALVGYVVNYYFVPKVVLGLRIVARPIDLEVAGPALLDARNKVTITARIQGYLKKVNVDLANQLVAAEADAAAAANAIGEARSDQQRATALADKAKQDHNRKLPLRDRQIITEADWSATEAAYNQTQAELLRSGTTILKATAQSASAAANVKLLKVRLGYATITSPLSGVVISRDRNVGDLLSPGTSLLQLVDPESIILSARLDESVMGIIAPGQMVAVHFASAPHDEISGSVLRVVRLVDQETREFTVDVTLRHLPTHWALGQRANVVIKAPSISPAISIPQNFIARRNGRVGVWRLTYGSAQWARIDLGYPSGDHVQVLNGLNVDNIILDPDRTYAYMLAKVSEVTR
jgi:HlyD family secretion protein